LPNVRALIFEAVPESVVALGTGGMRAVLEQLHALVDLAFAARPAMLTPRRAPVPAAETMRPSAADREADLLSYTTRAIASLPDMDHGARVLRLLTDEARLSLLVDRHTEQLRLMYKTHGHVRTRALLERFLTETKASSWPQEQSAAFIEWLDGKPGILGS
jgi:hypothetical protein